MPTIFDCCDYQTKTFAKNYFPRVFADPVITICGGVWQMQIRMLQRHVQIRLAGAVCFEIHSQIAVHQGWMSCDVSDIVACHRVDCVDTMLRLM